VPTFVKKVPAAEIGELAQSKSRGGVPLWRVARADSWQNE